MAERKTVQRKNNTRRPTTTTRKRPAATTKKRSTTRKPTKNKNQTLSRSTTPRTPEQRRRMQQKRRAQMLRRKRITFFTCFFAVIIAIVLLVVVVTRNIHSGMAKSNTLTLTDENVVFEEVTPSEGLDKKELASYAKGVVSEYNKEVGKKKIKIKKVSEYKDSLYIKTVYEDLDVYSNFSGYEAFSGTIQEALDAGYDFSTTFVAVSDGKKGDVADTETVCADPSLKVLIIRENATFAVNGTVLFVSDENTTVKDGSTVVAAEGNDNASAALTYIIYK